MLAKKSLLGLVAAAAITLSVGAASASATTLCRIASNPCGVTNAYPAGTSISMSLTGSLVVTTSGGLINPRLTCTRSTLGFTTVSPGGPSGFDVNIELDSAAFSSCTSTAPTGCSVALTTFGFATTGWIEATATAGNGTLLVQPPGFSVTCPSGGTVVTCAFGSNAGGFFISGTLAGSASPTLTFTSQTLPVAAGGNPACPTAARFSATYRLTGPGPLFVEDF